jgi:uncharacterized membrane protein
LSTNPINFILALLVIVVSASCTKKVGKLAPVTPTAIVQLPAVVSFSNDIQPVFNANCNSVGCHSAVSPAASLDLTAVSAYANLINKHEIYVANPSGSNLVILIAGLQMPKPPAAPLTDYEQQLILNWIQQGAMNN